MSSLFTQLKAILSAPGKGVTIQASASIQLPTNPSSQDEKQPTATTTSLSTHPNPSRASRIYDKITALAGTRVSFCLTLACLLAWGITGALTGATQTWQIVLQDAGSIQCYFSDSLLMRQQQINCTKLLTLICRLRSRTATCHRLLQHHLLHHKPLLP
ncbi:hypothetical protein BO71DRAFT_411649, partial [Aspergillus ellipticus CBS 707.79]